jgi:O-antigen/teichoic acid export membrane protein
MSRPAEDGAPEDTAPATASIGGDATWLLVGRFLSAAIGWASTAVIARELSPDAWGGYSFVYGLFGIVGLIVDLQVGRIVLRQVIDAGPRADRVVGSYTSFRIVIGVAAMAIGAAVSLAGGYSSSIVWATLIVGSSLVLMSPGWGIHVWFQARLKLRPVALASIAAAVAQLVTVLALAAGFDSSLIVFAIPAVVTQAVFLVWLIGALRREGFWPRLSWVPREWAAWVREAAPLAIGFGLVSIYLKLDILLLSRLDSIEAVGLYGIGYKFSDLATFIPVALMTPVLTVMVLVPEDTRAALGAHFRQAFALLFVAGTGIAIGFALVAAPLIELLYGERYAPAANAARLLVLGASIGFLSHLCVTTLVACGRNKPYAYAGLAGLVLNVVLNLALIPRFSFRGSAVATIATEVVVLVLLGVALRHTPGVVRIPYRVVIGSLVSGAGMVVVYLATNLVVPWFVSAAASVATFVGLLHLLRVDGPGGLRALAENVHFRSDPDLLRAEAEPQTVA